jgi:hypothetical protein
MMLAPRSKQVEPDDAVASPHQAGSDRRAHDAEPDYAYCSGLLHQERCEWLDG